VKVRAAALFLSAFVVSTGCASGKPPVRSAKPAGPSTALVTVDDPSEVARAFWVALAERDPARAAALGSFPFDLDAHDGCVGSEAELRELLGKSEVPPETRIVIGDVREIPWAQPVDPVAKPAAWPEEHWRSHLDNFTAADAKCLRSAEASPVYRYYFVAFTVGGEAVGALTRMRCFSDGCKVAGTDN
jgi:hypothetical protein